MATKDELLNEWQIALEAPNGHKLYAQQLVGDGYDSDNPYDFYAVDANLECLDQDVIDGSDYISSDARDIDWPGLIAYACEYAYDGPDASAFKVFADEFDACTVLDADDLSEALMDAGVM